MGKAKRRKAVLGDAYGTPEGSVEISFTLKKEAFGVPLPPLPSGIFLLEAAVASCESRAVCMVAISFNTKGQSEHSVNILGVEGKWTARKEVLLEKALTFISRLPEAQIIDYGQSGGQVFWAEASKDEPGQWRPYSKKAEDP